MSNNEFREERTRVIFNLPLEDRREEKAINFIIQYLQQQRTDRVALGGFTYSTLKNAVFHGFWWSEDEQQWVKDRIVLFIIDYCFHVDDRILIQHLRELRDVISDAYGRYGSTQEEIWLVSHSITRYTA